MALLASALERDTRGFISITIIRPVAGSMANWMLQPPVSTPTVRMMPSATSRICWYSRSVKVIAGATVIESPVCTPIGSRFSIEQTITTLSARSRITSSSYSFHPRIDSSTNISVVGLAAKPAPAIRASSASVCANPDPAPPMVKLGRITSGNPRSFAAAHTWSMLVQVRLRATPASGGLSFPPASANPLSPGIDLVAASSVTTCLKLSRSSPRWMASTDAPSSSTPYLVNVPSSDSATAAFSAVCPPRVASRPSGRSASITLVTMSGVIGST